MDPRQVELSKSERCKILLLAIADCFPWKVAGVAAYYALVYQVVDFLPPKLEGRLDRHLATFVVCIASAIALNFAILIFLACYETLIVAFKRSYSNRLREAQREALEKVDDQLLK